MSGELLLIRRTPATAVSIPIATLQDASLSFRARGILALLLTYENDSLISTADLSKYGTEGRDAARTALAELRVKGYVKQVRYTYKDDRGRGLWAWETTVGDCPLPSPENPSSVGSVTEKPSSVIGLVTQGATRRGKPCDTPDITTTTEDGFSGFLTTSYNYEAISKLKSHTSYEIEVTPDPLDQAGPHPRGGWDRVKSSSPKHLSKRQQARAARAAEVSTDFAAVLEAEEQASQPEVEPAATGSSDALAEKRQQIVLGRSRRPQGPAATLAAYFRTTAVPQVPDEPASRFNDSAIASNIARWRKDGAPDQKIRTMIETYWSGTFRRNLKKPAWQDFLAQQGQILGQSSKASTVLEWEANRLNDSYWT